MQLNIAPIIPPPEFDKALSLEKDNIKLLNVSVIILNPSVPFISIYSMCNITSMETIIIYTPINLLENKFVFSFLKISNKPATTKNINKAK